MGCPFVLTYAPAAAIGHGFVNEPLGTHSSRTLMLAELRVVLSSVPCEADLEDYRRAVVDENVAAKSTLSTRAKSFRHLRELYALSPDTPLFRALRTLWTDDPEAQSHVALLCAAARDPLLRATSDLVLALRPGAEVTPAMFTDEIAETFPGRYEPGVRARIGRNVASSWQQAGFLIGRSRKVRTRKTLTEVATAYALFQSYLCGDRGNAILQSIWVRLLDHPEREVRLSAQAASRQGWLEYREAGGVTDITFRHLLEGKDKAWRSSIA